MSNDVKAGLICILTITAALVIWFLTMGTPDQHYVAISDDEQRVRKVYAGERYEPRTDRTFNIKTRRMGFDHIQITVAEGWSYTAFQVVKNEDNEWESVDGIELPKVEKKLPNSLARGVEKQ